MTEQDVLERLRSVSDPEIPDLSIVDLGMVVQIQLDGGTVHVTLRPTFTGCPALDWIRRQSAAALRPLIARVTFDMSRVWSPTDITPAGRIGLRAFGIAPPSETPGAVPCPLCGSTLTRLTSEFGSTLCRALYYCEHCEQPFEAWKTPAALDH